MKKPMCVMYIASVITVLCLLGSVAGGLGQEITFGADTFEPQPVNMYFYSGEEGGLLVEVPMGNTTAEVECPGNPTPRLAGYYIGTWASRPINTPVEIDDQISCGLWAYSNEQANNVHFNVEFYVNGQELFQFTTESSSLSITPEEIIGSGQSQEPILLATGDIISVRLAYFSDSRFGVGPGADSILIVGDAEHDTHITVTASPMTLEIQEPEIQEQFVVISAYINDSFASTRYFTGIKILGRTDVEAISEPTFTREGNATIATWIWDFKMDEAQDGEYRVSISVSYSEDNEFSAVETYDMEFQKDGGDDDFINNLGWLGWLLITLAVAACAAVSYRVVKKRREEQSP
jgi:hypothetical protein